MEIFDLVIPRSYPLINVTIEDRFYTFSSILSLVAHANTRIRTHTYTRYVTPPFLFDL